MLAHHCRGFSPYLIGSKTGQHGGGVAGEETAHGITREAETD